MRFNSYGGAPMDKQFLTAALQNPANEIIAEELFRLALPDAWLVSGCLVQTVWNVLTKPRGRLRHQRLRRVLFRSRYVVGSGRQGHPHAGGAVCRPRHCGRGAQPGARSSLVSRKAWPALPGAALFDGGHRPVSDQEYADRNPAHAARLTRCTRRMATTMSLH